jgi:hypothetical protein
VRRLLAAVLVAAAAAQPAAGARPTTIVVTAGRPHELAFRLSKAGFIRPGVVVFDVTNRGHLPHGFEICTHPVREPPPGVANRCVGAATKVLAPGESASLELELPAGAYEYVSTDAPYAAGGMKGLIGVGVARPPEPANLGPHGYAWREPRCLTPSPKAGHPARRPTAPTGRHTPVTVSDTGAYPSL